MLAVSTLEKAIATDSEYWLAHELLANAYLKQQGYEEARRQAELAIEKGEGARHRPNSYWVKPQ